LRELGAEAEEARVCAREILPSGKSNYFLCGRKVSASAMRSLKPVLIDFHHQRDQQKLLAPGYQLDILDTFAGCWPLRDRFGELFRSLKKDLARLTEMQAEAERQRAMNELYRYQHEELEKAGLKAGEDLELSQQYELASHTAEILELTDNIQQSLFGADPCIFDQIKIFQHQLERFSGINTAIAQALQCLNEAGEALKEINPYLAEIQGSISHDPEHLLSIQTRLDQINTLLYKHKVKTAEELISLFEERSTQIAALESFETQIADLQSQIEREKTECVKLADELTIIRQKAAKTLSAELVSAVRALAMEDAELQIHIDKKDKAKNIQFDLVSAFSESGQDRIETLFSANKGVSAKALDLVASGGELSRILLAMKQVLVARLAPKLLILDEIDAGIGGRTAEMVATSISEIALRHPVLCVTHLAQIAAQAKTHIRVEKLSDTQSTKIGISILDAQERNRELARMLSGSVTEAALRHAEELRNKP
jgi:DNA repair protein RecN (Recombination protein N)